MAETAPPAARDEATRTKKGEHTREQILRAALRLFKERGYEETTMRAIAQEAEVAVGNAYYYFRSKEHLIQAFYGLTHAEHLAACEGILERERGFAARLLGVMRAKVDTAMPYHRFAGVLFKTAADPESPLNPFSPESQPLRRQATALFAEVLRGARLKVTPELAAELPDLLWLYHMGVLLFWIHDRSPGCARTYLLVEHTVPLVARLISSARFPLFRPVIRSTLDLIRELRAQKSAPEGGG